MESSAAAVVYSNYFTGIHGDYLRGSISTAGLDTDNLPEAHPSAMSFKSRGSSHAKAWCDIWGSGQGIGVPTEQLTARQLVDQLAQQYQDAITEMKELLANPTPAQ